MTIGRLLNNWKPARGTRVLDKEDDDARQLKHAGQVKAFVRHRDGRCRWPEPHRCRFNLECVHVKDASLMGSMEPWNLILLCGWVHRRGPESIHGKQLRVERETAQDVKHTLFSFWKQDASGEYYLIAREVAPFQYEKD